MSVHSITQSVVVNECNMHSAGRFAVNLNHKVVSTAKNWKQSYSDGNLIVCIHSATSHRCLAAANSY